MTRIVCLCLLVSPLLPASAQEFDVSITIPRLDVAEYHRPYVAFWVSDESNGHILDLEVWYDTGLADLEGNKWLKDMRQWWRRSGRTLDMPVDGLAAATRPQGQHDLSFTDKVSELEPGNYQLNIEAVREVGGREMLQIPFTWPPAAATTETASGDVELGEVRLVLSP
ncbi:MAG TPA: DUF2271 domain-containing protein [Pseudohongiella sp.]|nr:hypothetical protein [Gammaproteobacteria bacterium]HBN15707.1 DUF2271 domain-containing protein [Pseudohongiella sp.]